MDDDLISTLQRVKEEVLARYEWSAWQESHVTEPVQDIHGKWVSGRVWHRHRYVLIWDIPKVQYVDNVLDMMRAPNV